jgi:hypothetical protein
LIRPINGSESLIRARRWWALLGLLVGGALPAQDSTRTVLPFLGGAATAFVAHELSHVAADVAFGAQVSFKRVEFHGIPFFAVEHRATVSRRQEYVISSAGFWSQHASSEWLLTRHPSLRTEHAPFAKGVLAFNVLTSTGYALAAFAETGPAERDTRSIAVGARLREPTVGVLILAPAALDVWRYYHPGQPAAVWVSRGIKIGLLALVTR